MAVGNMEGIEVGEMGEGGQEVYISSYKMGPGALMYSIVTYLIILCVQLNTAKTVDPKHNHN